MSSRYVPWPRMKRAPPWRGRGPTPSGRPRGGVTGSPADAPEAGPPAQPRVARRRLVGDRDVDRLADGALHADLLRHVVRVHPGREDVAALDTDVVVRAVAAEHRAAGVLLHGGAAAERHLALPDPPHRDVGHGPARLRSPAVSG